MRGDVEHFLSAVFGILCFLVASGVYPLTLFCLRPYRERRGSQVSVARV